MENKKLERRSFHFYGTVQGVGFRYRAHWAAQHLGLTGWVANLWDGSVLMEAQGAPEQLDKVVRAILNNSRYIELTDLQMKTLPVVEGERRFSVRSGGEFGY